MNQSEAKSLNKNQRGVLSLHRRKQGWVKPMNKVITVNKSRKQGPNTESTVLYKWYQMGK